MRRRIAALLIVSAVALVVLALPAPLGTLASIPASAGLQPREETIAPWAPPGLEKLEHLVFIVQENRSFDHYFGTYPGADGIPRKPGAGFTVCVPDPVLGRCVHPYHSRNPVNQGGPHGQPHARIDINDGKMNGFIRALLLQNKYCPHHPFEKRCDDLVGPQRQPDVMSFHTRNEIPNYWAWADAFVLQDRMFESVDSWTVPSHLYLVSGWSAVCRNAAKPFTCEDDSRMAGASNIHAGPPDFEAAYGWTDITHLLHEAGVSWRYYVGDGSCLQTPCGPKPPSGSPWGWNPLPAFWTVRDNGEVGNVQEYQRFLSDAAAGDLAAVTWVIPGSKYSEHPGGGSMEPGYRYLTETVNALMESPNWGSMAVFIAWDDWGGFYDHVVPPEVRGPGAGYGLRVPGLMLSPYARAGTIDHQTLSFDAYLKLIEDRFLGGARLNPETMSRPDPRPVVREEVPVLGDLTSEFDFSQDPLPPLILDPEPPT